MKAKIWSGIFIMAAWLVLLLPQAKAITGAAAHNNEVDISVYQVKHIVNNKLLRRRLNLLKYDSSKTIPAFSIAGNLKAGDLLSFELTVKNPALSYCLIGVDAKNNYHSYGPFLKHAGSDDVLEIPAANKALQLDYNGIEHFIILVSNKPLEDAFFKSMQGIEMTMSHNFYKRAEGQLGSRLCRQVIASTSANFSNADLNFKDTIKSKSDDYYKRVLGDSVAAVVIDATVKQGKADIDSAAWYSGSARESIKTGNYEKALFYINKAAIADPFNREYYKSRIMILAGMQAYDASYYLIKNDLQIISYLETADELSPMFWYTNLKLEEQKVNLNNGKISKINESLKLTGGKSLYEYLETETDAGKKNKLLYAMLVNSGIPSDANLLNYLTVADTTYKSDPFVMAAYAALKVDAARPMSADSMQVINCEKSIGDLIAKKPQLSPEARLMLQHFYHRVYHFYAAGINTRPVYVQKALRPLEAGISLGDGNKELADDYYSLKTTSLIKSGNYKQALETANNWIKTLPGSGDAYFTRAFINLNLNNLSMVDRDCQNGYNLKNMGFEL